MALKTLYVFGTRPEAIKLAPWRRRCAADARFEAQVCVTGQHREMLRPGARALRHRADLDLDVMSPARTWPTSPPRSCRAARGVDAIVSRPRAGPGRHQHHVCRRARAYYHQIPVGHVEAGLRTGDIYAPWPEEVNRKLTGAHRRPALRADRAVARSLLAEGVAPDAIVVTGNTVIDALHEVVARIGRRSRLTAPLRRALRLPRSGTAPDPGHRASSRELRRRLRADLRGSGPTRGAQRRARSSIPVHLNPNVQEPVHRCWAPPTFTDRAAGVPALRVPDAPRASDHHRLRRRPGGGPSLGKPVLVMRETTERPEAVEAGTVRLVGTESGADRRSEAERLLDDEHAYARHEPRPQSLRRRAAPASESLSDRWPRPQE